jgi:hypothetical protein
MRNASLQDLCWGTAGAEAVQPCKYCTPGPWTISFPDQHNPLLKGLFGVLDPCSVLLQCFYDGYFQAHSACNILSCKTHVLVNMNKIANSHLCCCCLGC